MAFSANSFDFYQNPISLWQTVKKITKYFGISGHPNKYFGISGHSKKYLRIFGHPKKVLFWNFWTL